MIEDRVLKLNDEWNTDRATYQKYLSTHTTKAPKMDLNDKLNQGVRENRLYNGRNLNDEEKRTDKTKQKNVVYALKGYLNRTYDFARDKSNYLRDLEEAKRLQKIYSEIK